MGITGANVVLLSDLDNTVYDFVEFFGPAFRAMIHVLARKYNIDEVALTTEFKGLFASHGTLDYQYLISDLSFVRGLHVEQVSEAIRLGRQAFDRSRRKRLVAYEGVTRAFSDLRCGGVTIIGITNAPFYHAVRRLREVKLLPLFSGLVSWEGCEPPNKEARMKQETMRLACESRFKIFICVPKRYSKPSCYGFEKVYEKYGKRSHYYAIGDSIAKDLYPALSIGAKTIWARYGTQVNERNLQTVLEVTPWSQAEIVMHGDEDMYTPDYVIDAPDKLTELIPHSKQSSLF